MPKLRHLLAADTAFTDLLAELEAGQPGVTSLEGLMQWVASAKAGLTARQDIHELLAHACACYSAPAVPVSVLVQVAEERGLTLPSGSDSIDALLRGGFGVGEVTEVCGPAGAGKTQVALLATAATVSRGYRHNNVLYVDTGGDFCSGRLCGLLDGLLEGGAEEEAPGRPSHWSASDVTGTADCLRRVGVVRVRSLQELLLLLKEMSEAWTHADVTKSACRSAASSSRSGSGASAAVFVSADSVTPTPAPAPALAPAPAPTASTMSSASPSSDPTLSPPKLLVVDSITAIASLVLGGADTASAHALLSCVGLALARIAAVHRVAVVVTNATATDRASALGCQPALGATWAGVPAARLWLNRDGSMALLTSTRTAQARTPSALLG